MKSLIYVIIIGLLVVLTPLALAYATPMWMGYRNGPINGYGMMGEGGVMHDHSHGDNSHMSHDAHDEEMMSHHGHCMDMMHEHDHYEEMWNSTDYHK